MLSSPGVLWGQKVEAGPSFHFDPHQTQCGRILSTPDEIITWWNNIAFHGGKKDGMLSFQTFLDFFLTLLSGSSGSLSRRLLSLRSPPRLWLLCTSTWPGSLLGLVMTYTFTAGPTAQYASPSCWVVFLDYSKNYCLFSTSLIWDFRKEIEPLCVVLHKFNWNYSN